MFRSSSIVNRRSTPWSPLNCEFARAHASAAAFMASDHLSLLQPARRSGSSNNFHHRRCELDGSSRAAYPEVLSDGNGDRNFDSSVVQVLKESFYSQLSSDFGFQPNAATQHSEQHQIDISLSTRCAPGGFRLPPGRRWQFSQNLTREIEKKRGKSPRMFTGGSAH